jgi:serine/threonine protein kinase
VTIPDIDGFEDLAFIGRGGSADVYRAVDPTLGRTVAVKVLRVDGRGVDPSRPFLRECRAAERLPNHPNIATVHRSGLTRDGRPYVVVEDAPGGSIAAEMDGAPLPVARALEVGLAVATALGFAHSHGVRHRDVKPSNVLVAADGTPLLADFGLAAVADATATTTDGHPYTLAYAPPEVLRGEPVDERADVYSLGAMLHELLEGHPPFAVLGLTMPEVLARTITSSAPPLSRDGVSPAVRDLVAAMLSADPAARPDLDRVVDVLADPDGPHPPASTHPGSPRRRRWLVATVVGVAVAVAVTGATAWFATRHNRAQAGAPSTTTTTTIVDPYQAGSDESASLAATLASTDTVASALIPVAPMRLAVSSYLPPPTFPLIPSLPNTTHWRFSHQTDAPLECWEFFPTGVTMTGFASEARFDGGESLVLAHYAFADPDQASVFFRGRTVSLGVDAKSCHVRGSDVRIRQRSAPARPMPAWADEFSSWTLDATQRVDPERVAYAYVFRVGRTLWEVRLASTDPARIGPDRIATILDAVGRAVAGSQH